MTGPTQDPELAQAGSPDVPEEPPPAQIRRASEIYGMVVTGAVLASTGTHVKTAALVLAVFVTLVVYWLAEQYAEVGEHASAGHLPSWPSIRTSLAAKWPMVSASYLPLLALVVARLLGMTASHAAFVALGVTVLALTYFGWSAGRASGLRGATLLLMTSIAGSLGLVMIGLKILIAAVH